VHVSAHAQAANFRLAVLSAPLDAFCDLSDARERPARAAGRLQTHRAACRRLVLGVGPTAAVPVEGAVTGGITSEEEEEQLETLNDWMNARGFPAPPELSLTFRSLVAGDAGRASLCPAKPADIPKNASPVSGGAKPFPGRDWRRQ
jgi:hypothetical protein